MSFSFYSFDAEAVNDVERYAVGVQSIFNNQHPIANVWLIGALPADLLWCLSRSCPSLVSSITFQPLIKVPIGLFPFCLFIPFLTEL